LENLIRRYVVLGAEEAIVNQILHIDKKPLGPGFKGDGSMSLKSLTRQAVRDLERQIILDVLHANNWNRKETARILKISYRGLFYKMKGAGVGRKAGRPGKSTE
jgi:DNA-binding NtrC family response regulator